MQSLVRKILPFLIVGILVEFSASSLSLFKANNLLFDSHSVIAAQTPVEDKDILSESGTSPTLETPTQQTFAEQRKKWQQLTGEFRWDIYEILVGTTSRQRVEIFHPVDDISLHRIRDRRHFGRDCSESPLRGNAGQ
jgi:hypothetical protein